MGENYAILRFEKMKRGSGIHGIEAHHERLKKSYASNPTIDMDRIKDDYHLIEPTAHYRQEIEGRISELNTRIRKDSVVCIDTIITSGPEFFEGKPPEKIREFFAAGCNFMAQKVGRSNIISAVVHMDEKTPHLHMVFVPITSDGRLSAKDIIGGKKGCVAWQNEFFDCMSARFPELSRGRSVEETGHKHIEMSELRKSNKMNGIVNELEKSIDSTHPLNVPAQKKKLRKLTQELYPLGRDIEITVANIQEQAREAEERAAAAMQDLSREAEMRFALEAELKSVREQAEVEKREIKEKASYEKEHLEAMNRALQTECSKWQREVQRIKAALAALPDHLKSQIKEFFDKMREATAPPVSNSASASPLSTMEEYKQAIKQMQTTGPGNAAPKGPAHKHTKQLIR